MFATIQIIGFSPYFVAVLLLFIIAKIPSFVKHKEISRTLRLKAKKKRDAEQEYYQEQVNTLEKELRSSDCENVLKLNGPELLQEYKSKKLNPEDVLKIYTHKACCVTKKLNCVTEIVKSSPETAENLINKSPDDLPLYGIPVSMKECYQTEGAPSTLGWAKYIDFIAAEDCVLAKVLKHCGAVPFAKTNLSQMIFSFEGSNPIFGETSNPLNPDFVAGGSSCGEGSIVGAGASVLGFGTDIGGSIRCPAHFCGICGFKPTQNRLSHAGVVPPFALTSICATVGPMARDVDTIVMAMRALCCEKMFELDPTVPPVKFREEMYRSTQPLRIGYFDDNGYVMPVPACRRVVGMTKEALENAGHTLVPFTVPDMEEIMGVATEAIFADGGKTCVEMLEDDIVDERLMHFYKRWTMPSIIRRIYAYYLAKFKSKRQARDLMAYGGGDGSTYRCWQLRMKIEMYKAKFWKEWREKYNIDALICPTFPLVACPKGNVVDTMALMTYTVLFTIVNCPAGTVPVSRVTQKDIDDLENYRGHFGDDWDEHIKKATLISIGMPVGVQCVTSPFKEEICLRLMKEVETLLPMKKVQ